MFLLSTMAGLSEITINTNFNFTFLILHFNPNSRILFQTTIQGILRFLIKFYWNLIYLDAPLKGPLQIKIIYKIYFKIYHDNLWCRQLQQGTTAGGYSCNNYPSHRRFPRVSRYPNISYNATTMSQSSAMASPSLQSRPAKRDYIMLVLALILVAVSMKPSSSYGDVDANSSPDTCFIDREVMKRPPSSGRAIPLSDGMLHNSSVLLLWVIIFLCLLPNQRIWAVFTILLATIWFHSTYILLAALKALRADFNRAGSRPFFPNGISGHYCYFALVVLTLTRFTRARISANPSVSTIALLSLSALLALFLVGAVSTLHRTIYGVGNSTLLNALTATRVFASGPSLCDGLTVDAQSITIGHNPTPELLYRTLYCPYPWSWQTCY